MSMGSAVYTPWPISERSHRKVMLSSVPMRSHAPLSMILVSPLDFGDCLQAGQGDGDDEAANEGAARHL